MWQEKSKECDKIKANEQMIHPITTNIYYTLDGMFSSLGKYFPGQTIVAGTCIRCVLQSLIRKEIYVEFCKLNSFIIPTKFRMENLSWSMNTPKPFLIKHKTDCTLFRRCFQLKIQNVRAELVYTSQLTRTNYLANDF